jgi:hypothetical protein
MSSAPPRCIATVARAGRSVPLRGRRVAPGKSREAAEASNHEEETSPWKERAIQALARVPDATDPFTEKRLEVEALTRHAATAADQQWRAEGERPGSEPTARGQMTAVTRHGCERGELFEGSMASRGARPALHPRTNSPTAFGWPTVVIRGERVSAKRGEPHDRQRDATSPRTFARRKPSRWCETTRTERGRTGGAVGPTRASGQPGALLEWTREVMSVEGQQATNPRRGRASMPARRSGAGCTASRGARLPCGRF